VAELVLDVQEDQPRACAFYRSNGFADTGLTQPFGLDPSRKLIEMRYAGFR
jgi:ribosomal protein S18 acetylase RimI-like enzyme